MNIQEQIKKYIASQPEAKRVDIESLHQRILEALPKCKLWFLDGKDNKGKIVSNPNVGYGLQTIKYADGKTKEFYQIGISANTTGISVYIVGIEDKKYLPAGQAKFTLIEVEDIGSVAAKILTEPQNHFNKSYKLINYETFTFTEMAEKISNGIGKTINFISTNLLSFF